MYKTRDGVLTERQDGQERFLRFMFGSLPGRCVMKGLTAPWISKAAGVFLSSRFSRVLIPSFVRKNHIDRSQFLPPEDPSFNTFFSRSIRPEVRPVDPVEGHLISPCDSKLTVLPINDALHFSVKQTLYSLETLLQDPNLASRYSGGQLLIFRLSVDDYHRYCYFDDGVPDQIRRIPGVLHTVNPIANDYFPIYHENAREYTIIRTRSFGTVVMMEVGALLVGKIVNHPLTEQVLRGQEKGYFQFGGSTVIVILPENAARLDADILENSRQGIETVVRYGEKIGISLL